MLRLIRWMMGLCNHQYSPQDAISVDSPAIQVLRAPEGAAGAGGEFDHKAESIPKWYYQSMVVTVIRCNHCGATKHIRSVCPP